jgi:hypothetical protein
MSDEKKLIQEFLTGGWIVPLVGGVGMTIRLLIEGKRMSCLEQIKKIIAAILCTAVAWFVLEQVQISSLYKAISYGIIGLISPEIVTGIIKIAKKFSKKPEDYISK